MGIDRERFPFSENDAEFIRPEFRRFFRSSEAVEMLETGHACKVGTDGAFFFDKEAREYIIKRAGEIREASKA